MPWPNASTPSIADSSASEPGSGAAVRAPGHPPKRRCC
jgi:hypothetical protein